MPNFNVVGVFCEDIREEKSGTDTLVGVMPDNISVQAVPGLFPKIAFYTRAHIPIDSPIRSISIKVILLDGTTVELGGFDASAIEKEMEAVRKKGTPHVGFIFRGILSPMPIPKFGRVNVWAKVDEEEFVCASLNVEQAANASTASAQPSEQSQPASPQT